MTASQTTAYLGDLIVVGAIVAKLGFADELAVLCSAGSENLSIGDEVELATPRDGYCTAVSPVHQQVSAQPQ